jgi:hypothetical protein
VSNDDAAPVDSLTPSEALGDQKRHGTRKTMTMSDRHPSLPLIEDEWIVLLDVYLSYRGQRLPAQHRALLEASDTLIRLGRVMGRRSAPNFRQPDGLRRQLGAFRNLDDQVATKDEKTAQLATSVWKKFSGDAAACRRAADAIRTKAYAQIL